MTTEVKTNPDIVDDEAPEMEDIVDFINENEVTMHVLLAHENPYRSKGQQAGAVHWSCKLISNNQFVIIYFSKGINIRRWCSPPQTGVADTIPLHVPHDKINGQYDGPTPPFKNDYDRRTYNLCSQVEPPFLIEVLDVLAKDIWLVEQAGTFEKWAQALGTNSDSRAARGAFDIVCQQRSELSALLGQESYHRLLYEIDRINPIKFKDAEIEDDEE